ncbi:MAG: MtnX-like HAD-IB family phosphatase [Candidatus Omnitrophica bacterium]|nr:MtnX-like HAD-IB family phosphatase [Candidatus Omnitrophota bacterium]
MVKMPLDFSKCNVYFDFDNTMTHFDVLDDIIEKFSINRDWVVFENAWQKGEIGSRECLKWQMRSVRATKPKLSRYLDKVRLDDNFQGLFAFLKHKGAETAILSDSFSFFIERILRNNGAHGIKLYSNRLRFSKNKLIPTFPHTDRSCSHCANCKKMHISKLGRRGRTNIYIGDGLSDICPAEHSDIVFAKGSLQEHFTRTKKEFIPFNNLGDVYRWLEEAGNVDETEGGQELSAVKRK